MAGKSRRTGKVRWTICAMLFAATSINYMDRQVISLLKPTLEHTIGLTEQSYGNIVAVFQFAYALGLLVVGRAIDRLGPRRGYLLIMATWSLAAMSHALARNAFGFGVARFFLGLGEAGNFPAAIRTVTEWFPRRERALATGVLNSGANLGAVVAPALIPFIAWKLGWRSAFLSTGLLSAAWLAWWYRNYRGPREHPTLTGEELHHIYEEAAVDMGGQASWGSLLGFRQTWAFTVGKFLTDPIWYFYLFWLPGYFDTRFHVGLTHLGPPLILVYNASAVGSIGGGWLPRLLERFALSVSRCRMLAMLICACLALPMLLLGHIHTEAAAIAILSLAAAGHQGWSANLYTTVPDMFPSQTVGSVTGIGGMAGSAGAVLLSLAAGHVLQVHHSYTGLFTLAGSVYLVALGCILILAPGLPPVPAARSTAQA